VSRTTALLPSYRRSSSLFPTATSRSPPGSATGPPGAQIAALAGAAWYRTSVPAPSALTPTTNPW
jgi:hypothetical protein